MIYKIFKYFFLLYFLFTLIFINFISIKYLELKNSAIKMSDNIHISSNLYEYIDNLEDFKNKYKDNELIEKDYIEMVNSINELIRINGDLIYKSSILTNDHLKKTNMYFFYRKIFKITLILFILQMIILINIYFKNKKSPASNKA